MNTAALEVLTEVIRKGSLSAVARERRLTPSGVSRMIAALEAELGVRLLQRTTRRVAPTEAALALLEQIAPHLEGLRRAWDSIGNESGPKGTLRVTASTSFGVRRLAPLLAEFARLYPALRVEFDLSDEVVDLVAGRFDLAIRHGHLDDSSLVAQQLLDVKFVACASPGYLRSHGVPRGPSDLKRHKCLVLSIAGVPHAWRFKGANGIEKVTVSADIAANNSFLLRQCALDGAGIAVLADWLIDDDLRKGVLVDVFPKLAVTPTRFQTSISAVYPTRTHVPKKVGVFVEFLKGRLRQ